MSEPTLQDCINYMRSQIKQMEKHPRNYEFNLPYYRKTVELLEKDRPHGEWRDFSDEGYVECPFCEHATTCDDNIEELHYCFFCGAELRKSGEAE